MTLKVRTFILENGYFHSRDEKTIKNLSQNEVHQTKKRFQENARIRSRQSPGSKAYFCVRFNDGPTLYYQHGLQKRLETQIGG